MIKTDYLQKGEVMVEVLGPINDRNFAIGNTYTTNPSVTVSVVGKATVKVEVNTTAIEQGYLRMFSLGVSDRVPDPNEWTTVGTYTEGVTDVPIAPDNKYNAIRFSIEEEGNGYASMRTNWK